MKTIAKQITAVSVLLACLAGLPMSVQAQGAYCRDLPRQADRGVQAVQ